jgi:(2R)-3-sulfolactate dehydrogenase (NADP+)
MSQSITLSIDESEAFFIAVLTSYGSLEYNACALTVGVVGAELDGIKSHDLAYLPICYEHLLCGKVDGTARPDLKRLSASAYLVDARYDFAHPAIALGFE